MTEKHKVSMMCKVDKDIDRVGSLRCDVNVNGKKIGDFNMLVDPEKGEFNIEMKGKELIKSWEVPAI